MKRLIQKQANIFLILLVFFAFTLTFAYLSYAGIANTVHNMSTSAPLTATIKAQATQPPAIPAGAETEICVFCHIPHNAQPGAPLWNRGMPGSAYTMYKSDYLYRIGYSPTVYDPTATQPGLISKQCLSCHDGTVAIGAIYMVRGTILGANIIAMSGVTADKMPPTADGFIGGPAGELGNLTRHHAVGIKYDSTVSVAFGSGLRTIELNGSPNTDRSLNLPIVIGATKYVECVSCHDPHLQDPNIANDDGKKGKFLRVTGSTLAGKISTTCTHCHTKTGWTGSIHQTSGSAYSDASVSTTFGTGVISSLVCMNCHRPHKGLGAPYLLRQAEETTCFQGASGSGTETACHGSSATATTNNIQTVLTRTYKHPITDPTTSGIHTNLDVKYGTGVTRVPAGSKGLSWLAADRHAECVDCHNPHRATNTPARVGTASWYPTTVDNFSNQTDKSGALTGVTGVEPTWLGLWTVPTAFTTQESSTKEYQICFKCHSYWALSDADGITTYTTLSGTAVVTDQAMEFNPNNKSAHPVVVTLNNQTGSTAPKPLRASQMSGVWQTGTGTTLQGNKVMYCSDCHGTDNEASGDPKGPHGSSYKYMLKGANKYWPVNASGVLYTLGNNPTNNSHLAGLFCLNCHPVQSATGVSFNNAHDKHDGTEISNVACIRCHILVPHGGKMSRFIGDNDGTMPARYAYLGTITNMYVRSFTKATNPTDTTGYGTGNCSSGSSGCTRHNMAASENW